MVGEPGLAQRLHERCSQVQTLATRAQLLIQHQTADSHQGEGQGLGEIVDRRARTQSAGHKQAL